MNLLAILAVVVPVGITLTAICLMLQSNDPFWIAVGQIMMFFAAFVLIFFLGLSQLLGGR